MADEWSQYARKSDAAPADQWSQFARPAAAKKPYDATTRGAKLKGDTDPNALGDSFVGTLATDAAKLPGQVIDFPLQAVHAMHHPVDSIKDALVGFYNLPGQTLDELKAGKYGKVGARIFELLAPGMSTEEGAALASRGAAKVAEAATPVVEALGTAGTATGGAIAGGAKALVNPKTMVGAGTAEYVAGHLGLPKGVAAAAVAGPRIVKGAITGAKEALAARIARAAEAVTAPEVAAEAAGQVTAEGLAKAAGQDWSKLSANDRGILEHVAQAQNNAAAAPARPFVGPVQPPATSVPVEAPQTAPVAPGKTLADVLREEMEAKRAAAAPAPAPPPAPVVAAPPVEAPQPLQYGHTPTPIVSRGTPLRPPLATETRAQWEAATQQAPPVVEVPPARSLAQTNADMARKAPAPVDPSEVRTEFAPSGERKSPQLRGAEITAANRAAKAQRFAQALHANGVSAAEAAQIEAGALSDTQISQGMTPRWGDIARSLGENSPSDISVPIIIKELRGLEGAKAAEAPAPGPQLVPRKTAPGGGMGAMKNYWAEPGSVAVEEAPPVVESPANPPVDVGSRASEGYVRGGQGIFEPEARSAQRHVDQGEMYLRSGVGPDGNKLNALKRKQIENSVAASREKLDSLTPITDDDYWGKVIAEKAKDPRNITKDEWTALDPTYQRLTAQDSEAWDNAKAVAERIAEERGDIKTGPGEGRSRRTESKYNPLAPAKTEAKPPDGGAQPTTTPEARYYVEGPNSVGRTWLVRDRTTGAAADSSHSIDAAIKKAGVLNKRASKSAR